MSWRLPAERPRICFRRKTCAKIVTGLCCSGVPCGPSRRVLVQVPRPSDGGGPGSDGQRPRLPQLRYRRSWPRLCPRNRHPWDRRAHSHTGEQINPFNPSIWFESDLFISVILLGFRELRLFAAAVAWTLLDVIWLRCRPPMTQQVPAVFDFLLNYYLSLFLYYLQPFFFYFLYRKHGTDGGQPPVWNVVRPPKNKILLILAEHTIQNWNFINE